MEDNMDETSKTSIFPHKLCRSCLCEMKRGSFPLDEFYLERRLVDMLQDLISVEIELSDSLPSKLCPACYNNIIKLDLFKSKVLDSQKLLADKAFVIEVGEVDYNEQDLDNSQEVENDCEIEPVVEIDTEIENISTENWDCEVVEVPPKAKRKNRLVSRKGFRRKTGDARQKRGRRKESCQVCGKEMFAYKIGSHMRTHTKEKPFGCEKCGVSFADKSNLNRHMKTHEKDRPYICEICGRGFIRPSSMALHEMTTHRTIKDVLCPLCGKGFKHQCFLKKHIANIHNRTTSQVKVKTQVEGPGYQCTICGNFYSSKSSLGVHKMKHEQVSLFLCSTCGRSYSTKATLDNHQKVHTGEKNLVCNVCNKRFRYRSTLNTHVLVHSGEKPLSCPICNKQFRQHAHLNTHIRGQHSSNRPYKCSYCPKTFKQSCNLIVHTRIHTGETPYHCDVCQKGFYDSSSMKKHKKSHAEKTVHTVNWDDIKVDINSSESDNA